MVRRIGNMARKSTVCVFAVIGVIACVKYIIDKASEMQDCDGFDESDYVDDGDLDFDLNLGLDD